MRARALLGVAASLFAMVALGWWLWPREPESDPHTNPASESPPDEPIPSAALPAVLPAGPSPPVVAPPQGGGEEASAEALDAGQAPARAPDLLHYAARPMSSLPHRVIRGWGASEDSSHRGIVGAYVIVEPGMSDAQLIQLCRDIREYHRDADALSVRILDSEEAATYDRHIDGGAYKNQHQVATVTRDPALDVDEIRVRGEIVKP